MSSSSRAGYDLGRGRDPRSDRRGGGSGGGERNDHDRRDYSDRNRRDYFSSSGSGIGREDVNTERRHSHYYEDRERERDYHGKRDSHRGERDRGRSRSRSRDRYRQRSRSRSPREYHHRRGGNDYYDSRSSRRGRNSSPIALFDKYSTNNLSPYRGVVLPLEDRQRVLTNWDAAPPGFERISADKAKLTGLFPPPGNIAKLTSFVPPTLDPTKAAMLAMLTNSSDSGASFLPSGAALFAHALSKQARRVYVGGIPSDCNEVELTNFFDSQFESPVETTSTGPQHVLGVEISGDRQYAFVDFRSPDHAQQALLLDGSFFKGMPLSVRRTREASLLDGNFSTTPTENSSSSSEENQLVIANLPTFITEAHLKYLLKPFGHVRFLRILSDYDGYKEEGTAKRSLGIAVVELEEAEIVKYMAQEMNGFAFDQSIHLKVKRLPDCIEDEPLAKSLAQYGLPPGPSTADPTPVLQLLNAVLPDDLADDTEYTSIKEDIELECSEYGLVKSVVIPRPTMQGRTAGVGKVFVEFGSVEDAMRASLELAGRTFADRTVLVSYYPIDKFNKQIF